jgi:hypothetical protein
MHAVQKRRGLTTRALVPTSAALLADTDAYFRAMDATRQGDADHYATHMARAAIAAATESRVLARDLRAIRARWEADVGARKGSAARAMLLGLLNQPIVDAEVLMATCSVDKSNLYRAIDTLLEAGVLREIRGFKRHQIWAADEVLEAVDSLNARLGKATAARILKVNAQQPPSRPSNCRLFPDKLRRAFLRERFERLFAIFTDEHFVVAHFFKFESVQKGAVHRAIDRL